MKVFSIDQMTKGWFVGDFLPTALAVDGFEVGVKRYKSGDSESIHFHKIATEVTVIIEGQVKMNGVTYNSGSIILIEPNEATDFYALTDVITVVVKCPSVPGDKYLGNNHA